MCCIQNKIQVVCCTTNNSVSFLHLKHFSVMTRWSTRLSRFTLPSGVTLMWYYFLSGVIVMLLVIGSDATQGNHWSFIRDKIFQFVFFWLIIVVSGRSRHSSRALTTSSHKWTRCKDKWWITIKPKAQVHSMSILIVSVPWIKLTTKKFNNIVADMVIVLCRCPERPRNWKFCWN